MTYTDASIVTQCIVNIAAALGAVTGPVIMGAFTQANPAGGWRKFYVSDIPGRPCEIFI